MSAPPIPYRLGGPSAVLWGAWEHVWDLLEGGGWRRGSDLVNAAHAAGLIPSDPRTLTMTLLAAHRAGLLERDVRPTVAAARSTTMGSRPLRNNHEPWYRRPAGAQ